MVKKSVAGFLILMFLIEFVLGGMLGIGLNKAQAASKTVTVTFSESSDRTPTKTVNLPNATRITSTKVTSSTGGTATATLSGTTATVNATGASVSSYTVDKLDPYKSSKSVTVKPDVNYGSAGTVPDSYNYPTDSDGYNDSKGDLSLSRTYESEFLSKTGARFRRPASGWKNCPTGGDCEPLSEVRQVYEPFSEDLKDSNGKTFKSDGVVRYWGGSLENGVNYISESLKSGYRYYRWLEKYVSNQLYKGEYKGTVYKPGQVQTGPLYEYTVVVTYESNTAPNIVLNSLPSEVNKVTSSSMYVSGTVTDPEGDALTITYTAGSSTGTLTTVSAGSGTRSYSGYVPTSGFSSGTQSLTVRASDGNLSDTDTKSTVIITNQSPSISIDYMPSSVSKSRESSFYVSGYVSDPDNDSLNISWYAGGQSGSLTYVSAGSGSRYYSGYIPSYVLNGTTDVTLSVSDGSMTSYASRSVYGFYNSSPSVSVNSIATSHNLVTNSSINVSGTVRDSDGDGVSLSYTFAGNTVSLGTFYPGYGTSAYSFSIPLSSVPVGNYSVRLDVSDGISSSSTTSNTTNVFSNILPTITSDIISPAAYNLSRTNQMYVSGKVNDAEKANVTVSYSFGNKTGTLGTYVTSGGEVAYSGYIPLDLSMTNGNTAVTLFASDGQTTSTTTTNSVFLYRNTPPSIVFDTISPKTYNTAKATEILVSGTLTDVDVSDPMTVRYTFNGVSGTFGSFSSTGGGVRFSGTLPINGAMADGNYNVSVYGTDGLANSATSTQTVGLFTNIESVVTVDEITPTRYSDKAGNNTIRVSGTVKDLDPDDNIEVRYTVGSKSGVLQTVKGNGGTVAYTGTITVDGSIGEGTQEVKVFANDGYENSVTETSNEIVIDKTGPVITITPSTTDWTKGPVQLTANATDANGISGTNSQVRDVSANTASSCFTFEDTLGNTSTRCVAVSNLDTTPAVVTVDRVNNTNSYTKTNSALISAYDTFEVGKSGGSGIDTVEYAWSSNSTFSLDDSTTKSYDSPISVSENVVVPNDVTGARYLHVRVTDKLGTVKDVSSLVFNLDNTAPVLGDISSSGLNSTSVTLNGSATDVHSGLSVTPYQYYVDGVEVGSWTGSYALSGLTPNTKYDVTYKARDVLGNTSDVSNKVNSIKTLANAVGLSLGNVTSTTADLSVGANGNPNGTDYQIERADDSSFSANRVVVREWSSDKSYTDSSLSSGSTYYYRVRARSVDLDNTSRVTSWSTPLSVVVKAEVPGVDLTGVTSTSISLGLKDKGNVSGVRYYLERALDDNFSTGKTTVLNWVAYKSTHVDSGLLTGTNYHYRMKARNSDGVETGWSNIVSGKTLPASPTITSVVPTTYSSGSVSKSLVVNWNDVNGADTYDVYSNSTNTKLGTVGVGVGMFVVDSLDPNTRYDYYVIANNSSGSSIRSNVMGTHTRGHEPVSVSVKDMTTTNVTFTLSNTTRGVAPNHRLVVREKGKTVSASLNSDSSNKSLDKTFTGLKVGASYELWVTTTNDVGMSNPEVKLIDEFFMGRPPQIADKMVKLKYSEKSGHDAIKLVVDVNDLDMLPTPDVLRVYYTLRNRSGNAVTGHTNVLAKTVATLGTWRNVSYDIPVDSKIPEGSGYTLELNVRDSQGFSDTVTSKAFLVDKSAPSGSLSIIGDTRSDGLDIGVSAIDAAISGKHASAVKYQYREYNGSFSDVGNWTNNESLNVSGLPSLTKMSYRAYVRDEVENVLTTNTVEMVTAPEVVRKDIYYLDTDPSTIELDWGKALRTEDGVSVEVKRSGKVIADVKSGTKFVDKGLDYERSYEYELVAHTLDQNGNRIDSTAFKIVVDTGIPLLQLQIYGKYDAIEKIYRLNRTLFSDEARVYGDVFYKPGGLISVGSNDSNGYKSLDFDVRSAQSGKFVLKSRVNSDPFETDVTAKILSNTVTLKDLTKRVSFKIKPPRIVDVDKLRYEKIYGN